MSVSFVKVTYLKCPQCKNLYDFYFFGVTSGIGPATFICRKCQTEFKSSRMEWMQMTTSKRARFVGTSLLYLALGGMISSNLLYGANEVWNGNEHPENLPFHEKHFQSLWFLSGAVMLSIQLLRLIRSKFRTKAGVRPSLTKSFLCFGWAFGLQMKVLLLLILVYELALLKIKLFS